MVHLALTEAVAYSDASTLAVLDDKNKEWDWIAFTSARGVSFYFESCRMLGTRAHGNVKFAAVGESTATALRSEAKKVDLLAKEPNAKSLAETMLATFQSTGPQRVLIPRAQHGLSTLANSLVREGHQVDSIPVYQSVAATAESPELKEIKHHLRCQNLAALVCFAPSQVNAFEAFLSKDHAEAKKEVFVFAIGETTAASLVEAGWSKVVTASPQSEDLYEAIVSSLAVKS